MLFICLSAAFSWVFSIYILFLTQHHFLQCYETAHMVHIVHYNTRSITVIQSSFIIKSLYSLLINKNRNPDLIPLETSPCIPPSIHSSAFVCLGHAFANQLKYGTNGCKYPVAWKPQNTSHSTLLPGASSPVLCWFFELLSRGVENVRPMWSSFYLSTFSPFRRTFCAFGARFSTPSP